MSTATKAQPARDEISSADNLCDYCSARCCRYFALPIDTPEDWEDYEYMRWYLLHDRATIFTDDGTWYLMVHTGCRHLLADHRCGIYETRPPICREYSTDKCEYDDDSAYERYFETPEQLYEYAEAVLPERRGRGIRSPRPTSLPIIS